MLLVAFFVLAASIMQAQDLGNITAQKPFTLSGSVASNVHLYHIEGKNSSRDPFTYLLSGNFDLTAYGVGLPFSFMYSGQGVTYAQPFNRFGISPEYKWLKLHLGYRSMNYSSFTLAGHSFLGAGFEINPGKLRLSGVYGRFKQKTTPNTVNPLDTLYAPTRKGYSMRAGWGSPNNYFDLIFLNVFDDSLSVQLPYGQQLKNLQSNTVLGTHFKFRILKSLVWETDAALSLYTKDLALEGLPEFDNALIQSLSNTFKVNASSEYATAINTSLLYTASLYSLGLQYRRITPNYQSFGAYYFNTDLQNITINGRVSAFQRKVFLNGNLGIQHDDLMGNKATKSARVISMLSLGYNSGGIFSFNGSFSNYSISQQAGRIPLNDTIKLYQTNRSISLMPMLTFQRNNKQHIIQTSFILNDLIDKNEFTSPNTEVNTKVLLANYILSINNMGLTLIFGGNYTALESSMYNQTTIGFNTDVGKTFLKSKLTTNLSLALNRSEYQGINGWINNMTFTANYRPGKKHSVRLNINHNMNRYPDNPIINNFTETKSLISYVYRLF